MNIMLVTILEIKTPNTIKTKCNTILFMGGGGGVRIANDCLTLTNITHIL